MSLGFTRFSGTLVAESDLHVGCGDTDGNRALFTRDWEGVPVIPGSTLKGALRARIAPKDAEALFGTAKQNGTGTMGRVIFYAAKLQLGSAVIGDLPNGGKGLPYATHVAIDRAHGGAEEKKLFEIELVPAGARFDFDAVALADPKQAECDIRKVLAPLAEGLALGRGVGKGNGRVKLEEHSVSVTRRCLDTSGAAQVVDGSVESLAINAANSTAVAGYEFTFRCCGPYFSHDPNQKAPDGPDNIQFSLRRNGSTPVLWPESLHGVLRQRCAWIARTDRTGDGDCRFRVLSDRESPDKLTRTARLFGVGGWRGLLCLRDVALSGGARMSEDGQGICGIAIDRFSGAVLDGKLYFTDAWTGLTLTFTLGFDPNRSPKPQDQKLFDALLDEIKIEGLQLGHGTNRGFGWFEFVKCSKL